MNATLPEISVIGGLIGDSDRCKTAFDLLTPEMFGNEWAAKVFSVCKSLYEQGVHVDIATVEGVIGEQHRVYLVRCGLGKTDFALSLALNMSAKCRVSFCSMEAAIS